MHSVRTRERNYVIVAPATVTYSFMPAITQIRRRQPFLGPGEEGSKEFGRGEKFYLFIESLQCAVFRANLPGAH